MRIAIFSDTFPPQTNGVANFAYQSAKSLAAMGHEVAVFTVSRKFFAKPATTGIDNLTIINLPSVPALVYSRERMHIPFSATFYQLKKFDPDIIHTHTPFGVGLMAARAAKKLNRSLVGTHHTFYDHYLKHVRLDYGWAKRISWRLTVKYYNRCDLVLSPTRSLAEVLQKSGLHKPFAVVPNFIDTQLFRPAAAPNQREKIKKSFGLNGRSLVYMGRVSYEKSIDQVIRAFALMHQQEPDLKLMIIGDGPERKKLEKLAEQLGVKNNVIFTGFLYKEELVRALQANDIFLTASKSENMPLSVLEAMAVGLPIITVREKGLGEIVQENVNGFFARTDDPADLAQKTLKLLADPARLEKFSAASRALALEYSHEKVASLLEDSYTRVIKDKKTKEDMPARGGSAFGGKICLYLEFLHFWNGFLYKNIGTGLLSSYRNQKRSLEKLGVEFTEKWDPSCDILQINTPWLRSLWIIKQAKRLGKKVVIWSHVTAEDARDVFWFNKYFFPLIKRYLKYAYGQADLVFCPSAHTKSLLIAYGLPESKLVVQSNGVDCSLYYRDKPAGESARKKYGLQKLVIGTVGLVIPRKGTEIFLKLAQKYPGKDFIWFGKIYSQLMAKALPAQLPKNTQFTGFVPDGEINADFNALDIFVFLSTEENQGMVILEAAVIGLPILLRDLPAYRGWMVHNENCLIAKNDAEAEKYLDLLINDAALRQRLGAKARELSRTEDIKVLNRKLLETYRKLLEK